MFGLIRALGLKLIGGSRNERLVRSRMKIVRDRVNPLEDEIRGLSDEQLLARSLALRQRRADGASRDDIRPEAFALIREASRRGRNHRQFDVQLVAGMVLDQGTIAEEATGEGKTIACYPAIYMAFLEGMKVHVVTVNDYLVERDATFAQPIFQCLGVTVGFITAGMNNEQRQPMYGCDVTYGTNSEFGFDYLRDNTQTSVAEQVQKGLDFAIIDEVDSILIDEARTPLIISGLASGDTERFRRADGVAREVISRNRPWDQANRRVEALKRTLKSLGGEEAKGGEEAAKVHDRISKTEQELATAEEALARCIKHYEIEVDKKAVHLLHEGVTAAQEIAGVGSFYVGANMEWPHLMEQSLRAHLVFERDKDYVVQEGKVVIVDEFTGRILEGRQWSDGLHQAVEAKEGVQIKEETQTLATVTIQNYFKLYKKLAGMTGTAMTEAAEFVKIYKLDVMTVPTHRPVNRVDYNDRIYAEVEGKYDALVEEINEVSKRGRPVLVGTTSIEKSEKLSEMLIRRHGIEHQVLNARPENAGREADIVAQAGQQRPLKKDSDQMVGTVTIATNMAGRGTDIKLGPGVVWHNCKVPSAEKMAELGAKEEPLFPPQSTKCCIHCPQYDAATNCAHCFKPKLDADFPARGRKECPLEVPCGLHIVGTERHEARRIDNQLRGRSGRQGDPGSSRFFLSLRDDLMSTFASEWTMKVLGWLGLQGEAAIEDPRVSRGIERAQKKVEERNFEQRKNLLEYDEVMDFQRKAFYSQRQRILQGRGLEGLLLDMIRQSIDGAVESYMGGKYAQRCIAEWARKNLQIPIRDDQVRATGPEELADLQDDLRSRAKEEAGEMISITLGEYMDPDLEAKDWDLRGLASWAMSRFNVNLSQNQLRKMSPEEVERELSLAAARKIDELDLDGVAPYLDQDFALRSLAEWAANKFAVEVKAAELEGEKEDAAKKLLEKVTAAYRRREVEYPAEYALEMTVSQAGMDNIYAINALVAWANAKYDAGLTAEAVREMKFPELREALIKLSEEWSRGGRLERYLTDKLGPSPSVEEAIKFAKSRFDAELTAADFDSDVMGRMVQVGRAFLRREMTAMERFVLLQIYDTSWVDHLLAVDHLKSSIGLRSFAEQDPRVAFKREGMKMFAEMTDGVREKVTEMIFKVRLQAGQEMASRYRISNLVHEQMAGYAAGEGGIAAEAEAGSVQKVQPIVNEAPRVGRNDPCPCGSGKKYKKCHGKGL